MIVLREFWPPYEDSQSGFFGHLNLYGTRSRKKIDNMLDEEIVSEVERQSRSASLVSVAFFQFSPRGSARFSGLPRGSAPFLAFFQFSDVAAFRGGARDYVLPQGRRVDRDAHVANAENVAHGLVSGGGII